MGQYDLQSFQRLNLIDVTSEGPIAGLKAGLQSVYLDGTRLQNPDGSLNFADVYVEQRGGWNREAPSSQFSGAETENPVGVELKDRVSIVRSITNPNVTRARITLSVPALYSPNEWGATVNLGIDLQSGAGAPFVHVADPVFSGKTYSKFQRSYEFQLSGAGPWTFRVTRWYLDNTDPNTANRTFWDSYTEIIETKFFMPYTATVGMIVPATSFGSVPGRVYNLLGRLVLIPSNYDPINRAYAGAWDGTFKSQWSNNPAWVFLDMVTNPRFGLGQWVPLAGVDKWALYAIAQYCDELVDNGKSGWEPRFSCNVVINSQYEALTLVQSLASAFRGMAYFTAGMLQPVADKPSEVVAIFGNANVVNGVFNYQASDKSQRHSVCLVGWNDPAQLGQPRVAYVEDREAIQRFGVVQTEIKPFGCTSEGQARRAGRWLLFAEQAETEVVNFQTNHDAAFIYPGAVIAVADSQRAGERRSGRVVGVGPGYAGGDALLIDGEIVVPNDTRSDLITIGQDGLPQVNEAHWASGEARRFILTVAPFASTPLTGSLWVLTSGNLQATHWKVVSMTEGAEGVVDISALAYHEGRYDAVEKGWILPGTDITNINTIPEAVRNLQGVEELVQLSPTLVDAQVSLSWLSPEPTFIVRYRHGSDNWTTVTTHTPALDVPVVAGYYTFEVTPVNAIGLRGPASTLGMTVYGKSALPADVTNFRVQPVEGVGLFAFDPSPDIDVQVGGHFEIRFSSALAGVSWLSSIPILPSVAGTASSFELPMRPGTYLIKAVDSSGNMSANPAVIITDYAMADGYNRIVRYCDNPEFEGVRDMTTLNEELDALVLIEGHYLTWDEMTLVVEPGGMDAWTEVDDLPNYGEPITEPREGKYYFSRPMDMGGVFPARLTADIVAFAYVEGSSFIDNRLDDCDTWPDWDATDTSANGDAVVMMRQTNDDPANPAAVWGPWEEFTTGTHEARAFQFRVDMRAAPGSNVALREFCITADMRDKIWSKHNVVYAGVKLHITYGVKFYSLPAVGVTLQQGAVGDRVALTNFTREGVDIEIFTSAGAPANPRSFDLIAAGY